MSSNHSFAQKNLVKLLPTMLLEWEKEAEIITKIKKILQPKCVKNNTPKVVMLEK